ncbi:cyclic pyranopterin monophosphate synthase MoaC [Roseivirga sp. UBA1976]|uniref:cyclic pyranopterin monophosphate synthase MoaC n=1 Tax=Roseivirga sp. UBA1976 TaxID=1947386 RepID=UPI00257FAA43|nr:cyclic pyranopterin monophosphate synthase MoaC [Roseivirga sp. UBA1976]
MKKDFSHIRDQQPAMVDVGLKNDTQRTAIAKSLIQLPSEMKEHIKDGEIKTLKGPVFQTAIIAGIQAAKRTYELIPLCHQLNLNKVDIQIQLATPLLVEITCEARCTGKTGVEMEALTAVSICALTIYDMCKSIDKSIIIEKIKLLSKKGGKKNYKR